MVAELLRSATTELTEFLHTLPNVRSGAPLGPDSSWESLLTAPAEHPRAWDDLLSVLRRAVTGDADTASGRSLAYLPSGGDPVSAIAELLTRVYNRHPTTAPALAALEQGVIQWLALLCGLPTTAGGVLASGGTQATQLALLVARDRLPFRQRRRARIYVSDQTHTCVADMADVLGFAPDAVRVLPTPDGRHLDPNTVIQAVQKDLRAGRHPLMVVATAGTTGMGDVDPLEDVADVARQYGLWLHVDACYGGAFRLVPAMQPLLAGLRHADSLTLDPHKGFGLPFGAGGVLLVRDAGGLERTVATAQYLQDLPRPTAGLELTRQCRGPAVWLPLHFHGIAAYRSALTEKLALARHAYDTLAEHPGLWLPHPPTLSMVVVGTNSNQRTLRAVQQLNAGGRVWLSTTRLQGRPLMRLCVLSLRCRQADVDEAVQHIAEAVDRVTS